MTPFQFDPKVARRKQKNVEIFEETMKICREGGYLAPFGARINLPLPHLFLRRVGAGFFI